MTPFNIVLVAPEIPQNTGAIGRLAVSTDSVLHLIDPLGFSLDEKHLLRAGMDYWKHLHLCRYPDWDKFLELNPGAVLHLFSTHGSTSYYDVTYTPGDYLVFGNVGSYSVVLKPPFILPNFAVVDKAGGVTRQVKRPEDFDDLFATYAF